MVLFFNFKIIFNRRDNMMYLKLPMKPGRARFLRLALFTSVILTTILIFSIATINDSVLTSIDSFLERFVNTKNYSQDRTYEIYRYIISLKTGLTAGESWEIAAIILKESQLYGYDPEFIMAIIQTESSFNPRAVSIVGARGLMQIMPGTGKEIASEFGMEWMGSETLYDPEINIKIGIYYLFEMILKYKDVRLALIAYNIGPGRVDRMIKEGAILPSEYVFKVFGAYKEIETTKM